MKPIIEVKNLTKKYKEIIAVNNISFSVEKGKIIAFLGPNGAGKTTTIKMLTTLLRPTSGSMQINNFDPLKDMEEVRKSFGIVFQDPSLDNELTAFENLEFHAIMYQVAKEVRTERIHELLKYVELYDRKDNFVKTFSGGMKRRLEIARGLIHHPTILFLDEPTLGLDPQTRNRLWDYVLKLNKKEKMTVFLTTHYMEEADKVVSIGNMEHVGPKNYRGYFNGAAHCLKPEELFFFHTIGRHDSAKLGQTDAWINKYIFREDICRQLLN